MPALVRPLDVKLHEGAGQLLVLPRRGRLARTEAHDRIVHPDGLPRLQREIANDAIALVQQPEDGDSIGHGRDARLLTRAGSCSRQARAIGLLLSLIAAPASRKKQDCRTGYCEESHLSPESTAGSRPSPRAGSSLSIANRQAEMPPSSP